MSLHIDTFKAKQSRAPGEVHELHPEQKDKKIINGKVLCLLLRIDASVQKTGLGIIFLGVSIHV